MRYTLSNDQLQVVCDSFGGQLTSIKNQAGLEYLWQGDVAYWSGQAPVLFPICGSLRDDQAQNLAGQELTMPRHGLVRKCEFASDYVSDKVLVFSIESNEDMLAHYPYAFKLYSRYQLVGNKLEVTYTVLNRSKSSMPFFIGAHPGFNCPLEPGLAYEDYHLQFNQTEDTSTTRPIVSSGLLDRENRLQPEGFDGRSLPVLHEHFSEDGIYFDQVKSDSILLSSDKGKASVQLDFPDFPNLVIWSSSNQGPFIALEPMVGLSTFLDEDDCFEHKANLQRVEPGRMKSYTYTITIK